jgi:hypothetical protein
LKSAFSFSARFAFFKTRLHNRCVRYIYIRCNDHSPLHSKEGSTSSYRIPKRKVGRLWWLHSPSSALTFWGKKNEGFNSTTKTGSLDVSFPDSSTFNHDSNPGGFPYTFLPHTDIRNACKR